MLCIWWDQQGVIYYELLTPGETITGLMSHALAEKRFQSFENIKKWVDSWIASKNEEFFRNGIRKLPKK